MTAPLLRADSIGKSFRGKRVLSSASLEVASGKVVGLLGRMGEGKSTLLQICAGRMAWDGGWVEMSGRKYYRSQHHRLARRGLFFLADRRNLPASLTLAQSLKLAATTFGRSVDHETIDRLEVGPLLHSKPVQWSTGERRRAEIAVAMVRAPICLLMDEPFRGLDPIVAELIGKSIRELARGGCGVVVTGHEVPAIIPFIDSVTWMTSGTTCELGPPSHAAIDPRFRREYLGLEGTSVSKQTFPT